MAAAFISSPGSKYGPCVGVCHHLDCAQLVTITGSLCDVCKTPIGYERRFYDDPIYGRVHALCLESKLENASAVC